jgi:DNA-binding transcriptional regulator LsrR (DeoR family)
MSDEDLGSSERDRRAQQAAYLRARHNFSQEEIAKLLGGVSQSHVSRLLAHATDMGWLVTELRFNERNLSAEAMREIQHLLEPRRLVARFEDIRKRTGRMTPSVRVFDSGSESPTSGAFDIRSRRFGRSAAGRLEELLRASSTVGVTWGRTVSSLIDGLAAANRSYRNDKEIIFAPVSAELITLAAPDYSSSLLAARLNNLLNNGEGEKLRLGGVPAYIPRRYQAAKAQAIREYLLDAASYRRIFAGENPLINRLDTVITSVGSADRPLGGAMEEVLSAADITAAELKALIAGDVGGILIPKPDLLADGVRQVDELNAMWTGITKEHLSRIAIRSAGVGGAGIIVAAIGRERAGVVSEMIRLEMINELIIDWDLANALETTVE